MEKLVADDWAMDPAVFNYSIGFRPSQYEKGLLAKSWEMPDPSTYIIHLRQGIHWQNIPPANGRELTADDIVFHYHRLYGGGDGFTKPSPTNATVAQWTTMTSVTATDKYTIVFKWTITNPEVIIETQQSLGTSADIDCPDAVKAWGNLNDWRHAIGTGPFILNDFVSAGSATLVKNPDYWGYDERYPQNQLPYIDTLRILIIPDPATALAGLRTGKIDFLDSVSLQNAQQVHKTNPQILQIPVPVAQAITVDPRNDKAPYTDIKVREAMQMAIDLPTIAQTYYGGIADPSPAALTSIYLKGWGFPYGQWPQDLKDQFAYNPTVAKQLLASAGYPNGFQTSVIASNSADLDLLQIVKSYFAAVGINMDIQTMDAASWASFVSSGHKQNQLAYGLGSIGLTYAPMTQLVDFFNGNGATNYMMVSDPVYDAFYTKALTDTNVDDVKQIVKDANEYVARQHFVVSLLQPKLIGLCQPWLKGYNGQNQSISGTATAPKLLGFYGARFWIDQTLKKSLGY